MVELEMIRNLVRLQRGLSAAFLRQHPEVANDRLLLSAPATGTVNLAGEFWQFQKHGNGYRFEEQNGSRVVEFHQGFPHATDEFDLWSLTEYLSGFDGVSEDSEQSLRNELSAMVDLGVLEVAAEFGLYQRFRWHDPR